ncbi:uncharacterized protein [Palaemon carinicauda]|uniref:uncharacterized protein n=1 Tax=Palaemon carinicauda TaxID=392227 RepID=UPI0035B631CB
MKLLSVTVFALLLHSLKVDGANPTFEELQSQLPINLTPNGTDQYFFFIVPVQKRDDPNVILQMAQAQGAADSSDSSVASTFIDTLHQNVSVSSSAQEINFGEFFNVSETEEDDTFNFQVPVVVPLDFRFTYDRETSMTVLPNCSVDTRTWKEKVISRIAEKLQLDGRPSWDHSQLTSKIRLHKDALASITLDIITTLDQLSLFVVTIQRTKDYADIRYLGIIENITTLTSDHVSLMAEAVDTYSLVIRSLEIAEDGIVKLSGDGGQTPDLDVEAAKIALIKPSAEITLAKLKEALIITKDLQIQEANAAEEDS